MPQFREHHLHFPHYYFDHNREIKLLFAVRIIRDLVAKVALFFLPVFLFQLGSDQIATQLSSTGWLGWMSDSQWGLVTVAMYFLALRCTVLGLSIPLSKVIEKMGLGKMLAVGHILYVLVFALLMLATQNPWLVIPAAIIDGIQVAFFWTPYHVLLAKNATRSHLGQDLGVLQFSFQLIAVLAPAIAGAGIVTLGYSFIFFLAAGGSLLSMIFALQLTNEYYKVTTSWQEMRVWLQDRQFKKLAISYAGRYINDATLAIWPLYIFILLGSVDKVGYLYTTSLFLAMLGSLFVGTYIDHHKHSKWFFASGGVLSALWIIRGFVSTIWTIAIVDTLDKLTANFYALFFDAQFLKGGKGKKDIAYFTYRETLLSAGAIVFWLLFLLIFLIIQSWKVLFVIAAVGVLFSLLVTDSLHKITSNKVE
jgi:MFS family permease